MMSEFAELASENIQIDEISVTFDSAEVPNMETPYVRNEAHTGVTYLCITFTNLKVQKEYLNKLHGK